MWLYVICDTLFSKTKLHITDRLQFIKHTAHAMAFPRVFQKRNLSSDFAFTFITGRCQVIQSPIISQRVAVLRYMVLYKPRHTIRIQILLLCGTGSPRKLPSRPTEPTCSGRFPRPSSLSRVVSTLWEEVPNEHDRHVKRMLNSADTLMSLLLG